MSFGVYPGSPVTWGFPSPMGTTGPYANGVSTAVPAGNGTSPPGEAGGPVDPATGKKEEDASGGWVVGVGPAGGKVQGTVGGVDLDIHVPWGPQATQPPVAVVSSGEKQLDATQKAGIMGAFDTGAATPWLLAGGVVLAFFLLSR
jgi:hypothetical protein